VVGTSEILDRGGWRGFVGNITLKAALVMLANDRQKTAPRLAENSTRKAATAYYRVYYSSYCY
jgi:hypothetical protein